MSQSSQFTVTSKLPWVSVTPDQISSSEMASSSQILMTMLSAPGWSPSGRMYRIEPWKRICMSDVLVPLWGESLGRAPDFVGPSPSRNRARPLRSSDAASSRTLRSTRTPLKVQRTVRGWDGFWGSTRKGTIRRCPRAMGKLVGAFVSAEVQPVPTNSSPTTIPATGATSSTCPTNSWPAWAGLGRSPNQRIFSSCVTEA